ncbi:hypothetical protein SNE40_006219 [Patella caerulea]|uniref:Globin n=1 Tax=Patella caerulea TaxID=87958 RepID=A0AAN8K956_PATCE
MACAITGMTPAEKSAVADTWKTLAANKSGNGVALFLQLFSSHPNTFNYFKNFEGKSVDQIKDTADMRAHACAVMYAMGSLVESLDDPECMVGLVKKIARNHKGRDIGKSQFELLRGLYGSYLDKSLGGAATPAVKAAWDKFFDCFDNLVEKFQA